MLHKFMKFRLPKSENKPIFNNYMLQSNWEHCTLKLPASFNNFLTVLLEYIDLFQWTFENSQLLVLSSQNVSKNCYSNNSLHCTVYYKVALKVTLCDDKHVTILKR